MIGRRQFAVVALLFVLSGFAGLIYETAWSDQFSVVFGAAELAVAAVLAAYMGGLTLGALCAHRVVKRLRRPLLTYAVLELAVAAAALMVPVLLRLAARAQVQLLGGHPAPPDAGVAGTLVFHVVTAFAVLLPPTFLMGATLPVLVEFAVSRDRQIGARTGLLYGANTLGAGGGALITAFVLLPALGLDRTILVAVVCNVGVAAVAWALSRKVEAARGLGSRESGRGDETGATSESSLRGHWILALVFLGGLVSLGYEVLWVRLLSHLVGGSVYAFGVMLATFLVGLAIGSAAAGRLAGSKERALLGYAVTQVGVALSFSLAFRFANPLAEWVQSLRLSIGDELTSGSVLGGITLLPGAMFAGAAFPFAVRFLSADSGAASRASSLVYAWSTLGSIAGSLVTGFWLLPWMHYAGTVATLTLLSTLLACLAVLGSRRDLRWLGLTIFPAIALVFAPLRSPETVLRTSPISGTTHSGQVVFDSVGRSSNVMVFDEGGDWRLATNGLPESLIGVPGERAMSRPVARWLGVLPFVQRPEADSVLVVGFGAGLTVDAVPAAVSRIHVAELERDVIEANRAIGRLRGASPLDDERVAIHVNDARSALLLSEMEYDAIVSQPSHPWTSAASHLFTREFFTLVHSRLSPGGVFVQWMGLAFVDGPLLTDLLATLQAVFPVVEAYMPPPGGGVLMIASDDPLSTAPALTRGLERHAKELASLGALLPEDIVATRLLDPDAVRALSASARVSTDGTNILRTRSPKVLRFDRGRRDLRELARALLEPPGPEEGFRADVLARRYLEIGAGEVARELAAAMEGEEAAALRARIDDSQLEASDWPLLRQLAASGSEAAVSHLVALRRAQVAEGVDPALGSWSKEFEVPSLIVQSLRDRHLSRWTSVEQSEDQLAAVAPEHILFKIASELRVAWRASQSDPALCREALEILEPTLGPTVPPGTLLLRSRLAQCSGLPLMSFASLKEAAGLIRRRGANARVRRLVTRQLQSLRSDVPQSWIDEAVQQMAPPTSP